MTTTAVLDGVEATGRPERAEIGGGDSSDCERQIEPQPKDTRLVEPLRPFSRDEALWRCLPASDLLALSRREMAFARNAMAEM